ncbi:MAG TPA: restriction endonuclease subunit S [Sulfuriferula sp.]|nr:restriction endonuclease subunit S [Sulfuriferula sp.]
MAGEPAKICPTVEELPDGWQVKKLGSFCSKIGTGATPRGGSEVYLDSRASHALIRSQHVFDRHFDKSGLAFITEAHAHELRNAEVRSGDVLLNITGDGVTFGRSCIVPNSVLPACVNQHVSIIRTDRNECEPGYLLSVLTHPAAKGYIEAFNSGGSRRAITKGHIESFEIPLPPLPEQKAIARILGTLDDKIELNRRMNATLEAIARALFQSWFVDFDPVRAKLDGRQPTGLDAATAALFPAHFQDSPIGHIPQGWTIEPVGEIVACVGGGTPSTAEPKFWEGGTHHWTTPKDFSSLQAPVLLDTDRKITDEGIAKISSGLLPAGTLLLSSRAPVGYLAIAAIPVAINQGFIALKCNERASNFFMLNWCQTNMAEIESRATGTTFAEISKQNFRPILVELPPKELMAAFTAKVAPLYAKITANLHQSRSLATLRDALLPKLLSGEVTLNGN